MSARIKGVCRYHPALTLLSILHKVVFPDTHLHKSLSYFTFPGDKVLAKAFESLGSSQLSHFGELGYSAAWDFHDAFMLQPGLPNSECSLLPRL